MASNLFLTAGQTHFQNILFKNTAVDSNLYVGLMTNTVITVGQQIGSGITEVSGTGYARIAIARNTGWNLTINQVVAAAAADFTVGAGGWTNCNGYVVCLSSTPTTADAIFAEVFPAGEQGSRVAGDIIHVTSKFTLKDVSE